MPIKQVITEGERPVKVWTDDLDPGARAQLVNLSKLPFIHRHVAVMPDVHGGIGATIGSVIATHKAIIPAAVGVDIGCGMAAVRTSLTAEDDRRAVAEEGLRPDQPGRAGRPCPAQGRPRPGGGRAALRRQAHRDDRQAPATAQGLRALLQLGQPDGDPGRGQPLHRGLSGRGGPGLGHAALGQPRHRQCHRPLLHRTGPARHGALVHPTARPGPRLLPGGQRALR